MNPSDKNPQNEKVFTPKKKMIKLISVMIDPEQKPTISAWCEAVPINRTTYYAWFADPEFVVWFNSEWEKALRKMKPYLDNIGLKKATTDHRYWRDMQQMVNGFIPKEEHTINHRGKINLTGLTDDELRAAEELARKLSESSGDQSGTDQT